MTGKVVLLLVACFLAISTVIGGVDKSKHTSKLTLTNGEKAKARLRRDSPPHPAGNPMLPISGSHVIGDVLDEPEYMNATFHVLRAVAFADPPSKPVKGSGAKPILAMTAAAPAAAGTDLSQFQKYAIKLWLIKSFLSMYQQYSVPEGQDQINQGKKLFETLKLSDFDIKGVSGVANDLETSKLKELVAVWNEKQLISDLDRTEFTKYLDAPDFQKTSRGSALVRSNGEIVFSQVGYATTELGSYKRGTWVYTFRKVKFTTAPIVTTTHTKKCVLWGAFCETKIEMKFSDRTLTGAEGESLAAYVRAEALKQFHEDNRPFLQMLQSKAAQFKPFLPKELQGEVEKMEDLEKNPTGKRPDELFPNDPLDMNSFDL